MIDREMKASYHARKAEALLEDVIMGGEMTRARGSDELLKMAEIHAMLAQVYDQR